MACARTWLQSLWPALGGARDVHAWRCSLFPTGARPEGSARLRRHRSRIYSVAGGSTEDKKPVQENDENENCYYRRWRRTVKPHTQVTWIRGGTHSWFFKISDCQVLVSCDDSIKKLFTHYSNLSERFQVHDVLCNEICSGTYDNQAWLEHDQNVNARDIHATVIVVIVSSQLKWVVSKSLWYSICPILW